MTRLLSALTLAVLVGILAWLFGLFCYLAAGPLAGVVGLALPVIAAAHKTINRR